MPWMEAIALALVLLISSGKVWQHITGARS